MPAFLEKDLESAAEKKGLSGKAEDRYVYGAMQNRGLIHGNKITPKGEALQAKHDADMRKQGQKQGQDQAFKGMK